MNQIHPNFRPAATLAAILLIVGMAGCRSQPGGTVNPFLAPDRVPPPATRAILPGQAQPYYPGDPLPVMQSTTQPQAPASSASGLAWNAPSGAAPSPADRPAPGALAFANEPTVAIPTDEGDLRFPLPAPRKPEPIAPIAAAEVAAHQPVRLAAVPTAHTVVPASYTEPILNAAMPASDAIFDVGGEPAATGPWRSPQIATPSPLVAYGVPPTSPGAAPIAPQINSMDVRLRAVPSPPPQPVESNTPRIRLPGYAVPQPRSGFGAAIPPTGGILVQMGPSGTLPPPPYDPMVSVAASTSAIVGRDGFRPRSSMR